MTTDHFFTKTLCSILVIYSMSTTAITYAAEDEFNDDRIVRLISGAFSQSDDFANSIIMVNSNRAFILLTGQVLTNDLKNQATNQIILVTSSIRRIINEIEVVSALDESTGEADTQLHDDITRSLSNMDVEISADIKVVVHRGVVYLMGAVTSDEANVIAQRVSFISGVVRIQTAFEVIN